MALSEEANRRFATYLSETEPSNVSLADTSIFDFVAWALVHEPAALADPFPYESAMSARDFKASKIFYVQTVIAVARPLVDAYERALQTRREEQIA